MLVKTTRTSLALALLCVPAPAARADVILDPATASTNMGTSPLFSPDNVRNQSGLSTPYTSGVTDFAAYIASNPTHNSNLFANGWGSQNRTTTGNFDFGLGGTFTIDSFALWNFGDSPRSVFVRNVIGFDLLASADASFSSTTSLGTFTAHPSNFGPVNAVRPEVFTFAPTTAAFVRMHITSNNGDPSVTGFGEAAFSAQSPAAVPEPSSLALLSLGAAALLGYARRRQNARPE
jgi:hypothetical protein